MNASVTLKLTAGSAYSGVIEQYHEVNAFILAQRPASIRMIGQAPVVGKNIFDMVSDGNTFSVYIPSKNKFLTGPSNFERHADKPIENLRPQHLIDALLWAPIADGAPVLIEEAANDTQRWYVLTVIRTPTAAAALQWWRERLGNCEQNLLRPRRLARRADRDFRRGRRAGFRCNV